jgi:hypothetical protein
MASFVLILAFRWRKLAAAFFSGKHDNEEQRSTRQAGAEQAKKCEDA